MAWANTERSFDEGNGQPHIKGVLAGAREGQSTIRGLYDHNAISSILEAVSNSMEQPDFQRLEEYLARVPALQGPIGKGQLDGGGWWVKFALDISHRLAWNVVQELGHVLNYISINERLPTVFKPVSPPPYMNGGPTDFLSWVIECEDDSFTPNTAAEWLEGRLPRPVDDDQQWVVD